MHTDAVRCDSTEIEGVSLFEAALFLWSHKVAMAVGLVVGLLLAYPATLLMPETINRQASIAIYPSGTPTDTAADLQFQVQSVLEREGFQVKVRRNSLTVSMPYNPNDPTAANARLAEFSQTISDFEASILAKVAATQVDFDRLQQTEKDAATALGFQSFEMGVKDGAIEIVRATISEKDWRELSKIAAIFFAMALGLAGGLLVGGLRSYLRR